jgi:hypothetical protein
MLFSVNTSANGYIGPRTTRRAESLLPSAVPGVTPASSTPSNGERSGAPPGAEQTLPRSPSSQRDPGPSTPRTAVSAAGSRFENEPPPAEEELLAWETRLKERTLRPRPTDETPPDAIEAAAASRRVLQILRQADPSALSAQSNQTPGAVLHLLE